MTKQERIMRRAHMLTKELMEYYEGIDYHFQLGLFIEYLYEVYDEGTQTFDLTDRYIKEENRDEIQVIDITMMDEGEIPAPEIGLAI